MSYDHPTKQEMQDRETQHFIRGKEWGQEKALEAVIEALGIRRIIEEEIKRHLECYHSGD